MSVDVKRQPRVKVSDAIEEEWASLCVTLNEMSVVVKLDKQRELEKVAAEKSRRLADLLIEYTAIRQQPVADPKMLAMVPEDMVPAFMYNICNSLMELVEVRSHPILAAILKLAKQQP